MILTGCFFAAEGIATVERLIGVLSSVSSSLEIRIKKMLKDYLVRLCRNLTALY